MRTALNQHHLFSAPLIVEPDQAISSRSSHKMTRRIIDALKARDLFVYVFDDAIGQGIKGFRIKKSERVIG